MDTKIKQFNYTKAVAPQPLVRMLRGRVPLSRFYYHWLQVIEK